ncbi:hypothetical protein LXL04_006209 [Taraxacum kok-saghyz]
MILMRKFFVFQSVINGITICDRFSKARNIFLDSESEDDNIQINRINSYDSKFARKPVQRLYYYPRPSPQDVLHEEQEYEINNSYSGKNVYEWNLDGYSERQIYNMVHRMLMYTTIAKNAGNNEKQIAAMIIAGFTGQLKGWWDNYLNLEGQQAILATTKTEDGVNTPNVVYTLTCTIIEHFTGRWSDNSENIRTLLNGMFCKTLTSFRWYKDTFLSRVMELNDCNSVYWKTKFIDGLPHLFAERVKNQLRIDNTIPYENYTYGRLIGTCIQEGLALCSEIKLNHQIKTQHLNEKRQLGEFCEQFGVSTNKNKKKYGKEEFRKKRKFHKKKYPSYNKDKQIKKKFHKKEGIKKPPPTCFKCGKTGHYANKCSNRMIIGNSFLEMLLPLTVDKKGITDLSIDSAILYDRLKKNPSAWTDNHTQAVKRIKEKVKNLPCLSLANPNWEKIVETDASDIGFGGILKQGTLLCQIQEYRPKIISAVYP